MSADQKKKTFTVKSGSTGPAKRMENLPAASIEPPEPEELDARQARIRENRRKGPELPVGDTQAAAAQFVEDVPPTECDEDEEGA